MTVITTFDQDAFAGRCDTGNETSVSWKFANGTCGDTAANATNRDWTQLVDENFRVRFVVQETAGNSDANFKENLEYNLAGGGWNIVDEASSVVRMSLSSQFAHGDDTTQQVGGGSFLSTNAGMNETEPPGDSMVPDYIGNDETEFEFCVQIRSADVTDAQTLQLRVTKAGNVFDSYTNTPTITVSEPAPATNVDVSDPQVITIFPQGPTVQAGKRVDVSTPQVLTLVPHGPTIRTGASALVGDPQPIVIQPIGPTIRTGASVLVGDPQFLTIQPIGPTIQSGVTVFIGDPLALVIQPQGPTLAFPGPIISVSDPVALTIVAGQKQTVNATNFDGADDYITRGGVLTGNADGQVGLVSFWINLNGGDGAQQAIVNNEGNRILIERQVNNVFRFRVFNAANDAIGDWVSVGTYIASANWIHVLSAWDLANSVSQLYIDDVSDHSETVNVDDTIDYTRSEHSVGASVVGSVKSNACFSEVYINYAETLDLSVVANRRRFISAGLKAVDLGSDGSVPTGTSPIMYFSNAFGSFEGNNGSGGDFSVTGTLTACANTPPVATHGPTIRTGSSVFVDDSLALLILALDPSIRAGVVISVADALDIVIQPQGPTVRTGASILVGDPLALLIQPQAPTVQVGVSVIVDDPLGILLQPQGPAVQAGVTVSVSDAQVITLTIPGPTIEASTFRGAEVEASVVLTLMPLGPTIDTGAAPAVARRYSVHRGAGTRYSDGVRDHVFDVGADGVSIDSEDFE